MLVDKLAGITERLSPESGHARLLPKFHPTARATSFALSVTYCFSIRFLLEALWYRDMKSTTKKFEPNAVEFDGKYVTQPMIWDLG
jgi:hypothetical protein